MPPCTAPKAMAARRLPSCNRRKKMTIATKAASDKTPKSHVCSAKMPHAAPGLRTCTKLKKPGMTVRTVPTGQCVTTSHLLAWSATSTNSANRPGQPKKRNHALSDDDAGNGMFSWTPRTSFACGSAESAAVNWRSPLFWPAGTSPSAGIDIVWPMAAMLFPDALADNAQLGVRPGAQTAKTDRLAAVTADAKG